MELNQFEKKRKKIQITYQVEEVLQILEDLLRIPYKIREKCNDIERLLSKNLSISDKSIKNIERNLNRIRDEVLKKLEE